MPSKRKPDTAPAAPNVMNVLNAKDRENVVKSSQSANLLVQDLRALVTSDNPLLADTALAILRQAVDVEQHLKRIESITSTKQ